MIKAIGDYYSAGDVCLLLDISPHTLSRWYKWWESPEFDKPEDLILPDYEYKDRRRTKFFRKSDLHILKDFQFKINNSHKGAMSTFNAAYQWGKRGERALRNKGLDKEEVQKKMTYMEE